MLVLAVIGFGKVPQAFFPASTQPYFYVNYWRAQGTHIEKTAEDVERLEAFIADIPGVRNISSFIGEGTLRFILPYNYEIANSSYSQLLVEVEDYREIGGMMLQVEEYMRRTFPQAEAHCTRFMTGPSNEYTIEARFRGPDVRTLKELAAQAKAIMYDTPNTRDVRTDWRQPVLVIRPLFSENKARRVGGSRQDLAASLQWSFNGSTVGLFREGDDLIPIVSRPVAEERASVENLEDVQVWSGMGGAYVPLQQLVSGIESVWEDPLIQRRNRQRTVTVQCNPVVGLPETLRQQMKDRIEAIPLPPGYSMTWAGEYYDSQDAQAPLKKSFPLCLAGMFILLVCLFNSVRRPFIIFLTVPLAIIGVTAGLLLTQKSFGFMAILGFLGLSGMLIKNAIVLIDQIELERAQGKAPYRAILDSAVSRLRPVTMAAGTTILGMAPLIADPLYASMSVTIMGGLFGATFLTLIVVPVFYSLAFGIRADAQYL
jgi:multidrug efflux pump subunit AcrB